MLCLEEFSAAVMTAGTTAQAVQGSQTSGQQAPQLHPIRLRLKADLEQHAHHVLVSVRHRVAALNADSQLASPTPTAAVVASDGTVVVVAPHAALLQQAHQQRAQRKDADQLVLQAACTSATEAMEDTTSQLAAKGCPNVYAARKAVEVGAFSGIACAAERFV